jgi:hypothetical protein
MDYLIGHLVGDYLLQNDWQAMNKKANSLKGWAACLVHCILYTIAVCACTGWWRWDLVCLVFLSHFPFDKTYIIAWYMIRVGAFERIIGEHETMLMSRDPLLLEIWSRLNASQINHKTWAYLFVDNTVHLTLLWLIARYAV